VATPTLPIALSVKPAHSMWITTCVLQGSWLRPFTWLFAYAAAFMMPFVQALHHKRCAGLVYMVTSSCCVVGCLAQLLLSRRAMPECSAVHSAAQ
jgi:Na+/melibiose symporter-like transporter